MPKELNKHYQYNSVNIQIIDVIKDAPFALGSLLKYLIRFGDKDPTVDQKQKIRYYFNLCTNDDTAEDACINWWNDNWKFVVLFNPIFAKHKIALKKNWAGSIYIIQDWLNK